MRKFSFRIVNLLAISLLILASNAGAFWWGGDKDQSKSGKPINGERERLVEVLDDKQEALFLKLIQIKQRRLKEVAVLEDFVAEKRAEVKKFRDALITELNLDPKQNYKFDAESGKVFAEAAVKAAEVSNPEDPNPDQHEGEKPLLAIEDEDQKIRLSKISGAKTMAETQIKCLLLMLKEKNIELNNSNKILESRFKISPEKVYRYDKTMSAIYEIERQKTLKR